LSCIDEGGEEGLNYVLQLISFKLDAWIRVQSKYACVLAAIYWGEKGLSSLVDVALNSEDSLTVRCIIETLSYAAASALMPYQILCNDTEQNSLEGRSGPGLAPSRCTSLHNKPHAPLAHQKR
jgi:hypothetical protein